MVGSQNLSLQRSIHSVSASVLSIPAPKTDAEIDRPALFDVWDRAGLDELLSEDMSRAELILRYTISHPHCHTTIVGTCNDQHLVQNIDSISKGPLDSRLYAELTSRVKQVLGSHH